MLDLSVMELVQEKKIPEMVDMILTEQSSSGLVPGDQTLRIVVSVLQDSVDLYSLMSLLNILPAESELRDHVYSAVVSIKLDKFNKTWEAGDKVESWVRLIELYRSIWNERSQVSRCFL